MIKKKKTQHVQYPTVGHHTMKNLRYNNNKLSSGLQHHQAQLTYQYTKRKGMIDTHTL